MRRYFTGEPCKRGHVAERDVKYADCIVCRDYRRDKFRQSDPERWQTIQRAGKKRWVQNNPLKVRFQAIKSGAARRNIPFDLTLEDVEPTTSCKACGVTFNTGGGRPISNHLTIDRIDNAKGYTRDNIAMICNRCNSIKRDATVEDLRRLLAYMEGR